MTNIEKALHWAQELINEADEFLAEELYSEDIKRELIEQREFAVTALAALQEKLARESGCEHCRGWDMRCGANFCPMCGRKLGSGEHD